MCRSSSVRSVLTHTVARGARGTSMPCARTTSAPSGFLRTFYRHARGVPWLGRQGAALCLGLSTREDERDGRAAAGGQLAETGVAGLKAGARIKVLFEDREVVANDGQFVDDF